jgi:hypothetical protein
MSREEKDRSFIGPPGPPEVVPGQSSIVKTVRVGACFTCRENGGCDTDAATGEIICDKNASNSCPAIKLAERMRQTI